MMFTKFKTESSRVIRPTAGLFTSVAAAALLAPVAAFAQEAPAGETAANDESNVIMVTARRGAEALQNVPVSIQVVTGDQLNDLAITSVEEVSKLAPGLTLVNAGSNTVVTLRGVTWQPGSGTPATPIYFNEVPFDPGQTIVSLFDVGQIEVLRGPQGTRRGAPSISGAVTIATRRPDLNVFGGYVQGQYSSGDRVNVQAAINIPVIQDMLAVRLATNIEDSDGDRVYSVNSDIQPSREDRSYRATVLFEPTDTVSIQAMYQRRKTDTSRYIAVAGTGSPGFPGFPGGFIPAIPANFNGPALLPDDRAAVADGPYILNEHVDLLTINASWEILGHELSYNFGRQFNRAGRNTFNANDPFNILPGFEPYNTNENVALPAFRTHEIRLSSLPDPDRWFDYDIGWFSKHSGGEGLIFRAPVYALSPLGGAFGPPGTPLGQVTTPNQDYVLDSITGIQIGQAFDSFYGNVRVYPTDDTEISGGISIIRDRVPVSIDILTSEALFVAAPLAAFAPAPACGFVPGFQDSQYAGFCDGVAPAGPVPGQSNNDIYHDVLYNLAISHNFTEDLLVYATTGTSFRTGLPAINNPGLPTEFVTPRPETATSYELGVKATLADRIRTSLAVFQLNYQDQLTTFEGVRYFNTVSGAPASTSLAFYGNLDARVRGVEFEIAASPIDNLTLAANVSYARITSKGGDGPANNGDCAGTAPVSAANPINSCPSEPGTVLNTQAPFQASVNGSYDVPITDALDGYVRFNVNFQGNNPNFGNFRPTGMSTPSYAIVDLFAGLAGTNAGWTLGAYAKNVFDKNVELGRVAGINDIYPIYPVTPGYDQIRLNAPRELGVTARFTFGGG